MKFRLIVSLLSLVILNSCGPSKASIAKSELELLIAKQNKGKEIFENNCAKCHRLYDPKSYSIQAWQPILKKMQFQARLQDADMDKILAYLSKN
jgi:cytochrome c5